MDSCGTIHLVEVPLAAGASGSMDDGLLAQSLGEVDGVLRSLGAAVGGIAVYSCDAAVGAVQQVGRARDLRLVGGGTDLRVGFTAALARRPRPEVIIVITDADTPWPAMAPARLHGARRAARASSRRWLPVLARPHRLRRRVRATPS